MAALRAEDIGEVLRRSDLAVPLVRHVDIEIDERETESREFPCTVGKKKVVVDVAEDQIQAGLLSEARRQGDQLVVLGAALVLPRAPVELADRGAVGEDFDSVTEIGQAADDLMAAPRLAVQNSQDIHSTPRDSEGDRAQPRHGRPASTHNSACRER